MEAAPDPLSEPPPPPEELAIEGLLDEVFSAPKQRRMHYSMKQKRDVLLATL
ncbi:hypothetical protein F443_12888, partial [Phytophthora nicotianae P1569]